jgi:lipopolysaccharide transport system ATP-binding protein
MSLPIIEVNGISKRYRRGAFGARSLRDEAELLVNRLLRGKRAFRFPGAATNGAALDFWALRDLYFAIQPGEVMGIMGRNGAGKSTLLKILSRITEPTEGEAIMRGRVASLLEVGTGFHPELSGRENIYLNGAILGMRKAEVDRKLDEIVAFAEIELFLDTPVKRYSSGMYVRLAFAVAAHLDPEILIVDEVLAVGDVQFQKKCLGKMQDVGSRGRTILFVSHNMGMLNSLCPTSILLEEGKLVTMGKTSLVALEYYGRGRSAPHLVDYRERAEMPGDRFARLQRACVCDANGAPAYEIEISQPFKVTVRYELLEPVPLAPHPNIHFFDARGECVFVSAATHHGGAGEPGIYEAECLIPAHLLNDGAYFVGVALTFSHHGVHASFFERDALSFIVREPLEETLQERRAGFGGAIPGVVRPRLDWSVRAV